MQRRSISVKAEQGQLFGSGDCPVEPDPETRFWTFTEPFVEPVLKAQSPMVMQRGLRLRFLARLSRNSD
jgi:hypothetical protein